jgi:hypothetical protein
VIVIGVMRDPDTIRAAIGAAAAGHLVIGTLHASTASEVISRVVSCFDPVGRAPVKLQLRDPRKCVICRRLVQRAGGGRLPAPEVLYNDTRRIADGIRTGDTPAIKVGMQQDASASFIFEKYLYAPVKASLTTKDQGRDFSSDRSIFDQMSSGTHVIPSADSMLHHPRGDRPVDPPLRADVVPLDDLLARHPVLRARPRARRQGKTPRILGPFRTGPGGSGPSDQVARPDDIAGAHPRRAMRAPQPDVDRPLPTPSRQRSDGLPRTSPPGARRSPPPATSSPAGARSSGAVRHFRSTPKRAGIFRPARQRGGRTSRFPLLWCARRWDRPKRRTVALRASV